MYLLDTNICIYLIKNSYPFMTEKVFSYEPSDIAISSITVFELEYGASKSKWGEETKRKLAVFLSPFTILHFSTEDAIAAGQVRAELEKNGRPIGPYDTLIAAQGISRGLTVVTHNTNEFIRVQGIKLEDWITTS